MHFTERGHIALSHPETDSAILIAKTGMKEGEYLISNFCGQNYPKWNVYKFYFYAEELQDYIMENLQGWFVDKMNGVDINVSTGYDHCTYVMDRDEVMNEIVSHAVKKAEAGDYIIEGEDMIVTAVVESANTLQYFLTRQLKEDTEEELEYEVGIL